MALFSLIFLAVVFILIGVGLALGIFFSLVLAGLAALGILSSSIAAAILKGRAQAGFRLLYLECGLLAGIPSGILCAWLLNWFMSLNAFDMRIVIAGGLSGAVGGLIVALLLDFITRRASGAITRFLGLRECDQLPNRPGASTH